MLLSILQLDRLIVYFVVRFSTYSYVSINDTIISLILSIKIEERKHIR